MSLSLRKLEGNRTAPPSHRHAAPSAPWPWVDIQDEVDREQLNSTGPLIRSQCDHIACDDCWKGYPQSLFPNWTPSQVKKSKITIAIRNYRRDVPCVIHHVDVDDDGRFKDSDKYVSTEATIKESWETIVGAQVPDNIRVRALFIENLSGPILQMLGTKYNIEPFFFSSSLNWIPSRFQEEVKPNVGDHITITLTFLQSVPNAGEGIHSDTGSPTVRSLDQATHLVQQMIDTQTPLVLPSTGRQLALDLLSVHLIRKKHGSVIISYHPTKTIPITTAKYLHERIRFVGHSVYWQSIFRTSPDPTFVLLTFIWHAIYAWDEALETLYNHICRLEAKVVATTDFGLTQELHIIRAHHLHYAALLEDLKKSVIFVRETKNPALEVLSPEEREATRIMLKRECENLLGEINRLEMERNMQEKRLKNVTNLVYSFVNIMDSKQMQEMTRATVRDSAATKQIAYLTMVFLPATFVASVFGMNVQELIPENNGMQVVQGTILHYFETALSFTLASVWVITAFQSRYIFRSGVSIWIRLGWPVFLLLRLFGKDPYAPTKPKQTKEELMLELTRLDQGLLRERRA